MTHLTFHPLTVHRRGDDYVVSAEREGRHLVVDEDGKAILEHLRSADTREVQAAYPDHDVEGFVERLITAGLVHKRGHRVVGGHRTLTQLGGTPRGLTLLNAPLFDSALLGLASVAIILLLAIPPLAPRPAWLIPPGSLAGVIPLAFLAWWLVALWHELGHYVLLGRLGAPTRLTLIHKWHLILPHADTRAARTLARQQRVLVHLGGILFTLALIALLDLLTLYGFWTSAARFLLTIAFVDLLVQLTPLPGTDLTAAFEHATGTANLSEKLLGWLSPFSRAAPSDAAKRFLPAATIGLILLGAATFAYFVPWILHIIVEAVDRALVGVQGNAPLLFWDGAATLIILGAALSLYAVTFLREHRLTEAPLVATASVGGFLLGNFVVAGAFAIAAMLYLGPLWTTITLLGVGLVFGGLFLGLLDAIDIEGAGFARDFFLPLAAASTGILLMVLATWIGVQTGTLHAEAIHGIAYAVGMLAALVV